MYHLSLCFTLLLTMLTLLLIRTVTSTDICPGTEVACADTCTERLGSNMDHNQAGVACRQRGKRTYMGSRTNEKLEASCRTVVGELDTNYVWTRYKLRGGLVIDETGAKIDRVNWGIQYCGGINQLGQFVAHPCTWTKYAVCVTSHQPFDKDHVKMCNNEYYWITDRRELTYDKALQYCQQSNMALVSPYTTQRKNCLSTLMQTKSFDAWIDYNITSAAQSIEPWDLNYCIKVNIDNSYKLDRCSQKLPVTCATFGELSTTGAVVQKDDPATISCRCYNCTLQHIVWTDGLTTWRSNDESGAVSVVAVADSLGVNSVLTLASATKDEVFTCKQTTPFTSSVIYKAVKIDVYELSTSSHFIFYGARTTMTCNFKNDKHLDIDRVQWIDLRDGNNMTGVAKTIYKGYSVISSVEMLSEFYTHDVRCTFYTRGRAYPYTGTVRVIVYKIDGSDKEVPANENTTLTCHLREYNGQVNNLVPPTRVDWVKGSDYVLPSDVPEAKFTAVLHRNMRTGRDRYSCRFLFTNSQMLSKTLTVNAFNFEGVSAHVANQSTGYLRCSFSQGGLPQEPMWWEREGVKILDGKRYLGEEYRITSNSINDTYFKSWTEIAIHNATYSAAYSCVLRITGHTWRKRLFLNVYPGEYIANNVTIVERVNEGTGEIVVACNVWAYPRPNIQLFIDTKPSKGVLSSTYNMTSLTARLDRTCDSAQYKCLASNNIATRELVLQSRLSKKCGFFAKLTLKMWAIVGGVLFLLILIIFLLCCYFCRRTKALTKEVEYQREVLSTVEGASTLYSQNLSRGGYSTKGKLGACGQQYVDMYEDEDNHLYDPVGKVKNYEDDQHTMGGYSEPYAESGIMSPKYHRIGSEYDSSAPAPLFMSNRSKSRENMFSPPSMRKMNSKSYQNIRDNNSSIGSGSKPGSGYQSMSSGVQNSHLSRSATNLRKFSQPETIKMNPFGNVQRCGAENPPDYDEVQSITSRIPPSEISDMTPPVAILSPRGWEIPAEPSRMFSPPTARHNKNMTDRKFSEPAAWGPRIREEERAEWDLTPTEEVDPLSMGNHPVSMGNHRPNQAVIKPVARRSNSDYSEQSAQYPRSGWSTPGPVSTIGANSTDKSSSVLDSISITPMFAPGLTSAGDSHTYSPIPGQHPKDRVAYCTSPPPDVYSPPSDWRGSRKNVRKDSHKEAAFVFDIDDLSSVDLPENGMDTLDRRTAGLGPAAGRPPAENYYQPPPDQPADHHNHHPPHKHPAGVKVLPTLPKNKMKQKLKTSHF